MGECKSELGKEDECESELKKSPERGRHDVELGVGELGDEDGDDSAVDDRLDLLVGAVGEVGEGLVN